MLFKKTTTLAATALLLSATIAAPASANSMSAQSFWFSTSAPAALQINTLMAGPCALGSQGCVLPLKAPAAAPAATPEPAAPLIEATPVVEEASGGFSLATVMLGLAAIAGGIYLLAGNSDDDAPASP